MAFLILLAASGFLPGNGPSASLWRGALWTQIGFVGAARSPQPWQSCEPFLLFLFGIAWSYLLFAQDWHRPVLVRALRVFTAGMLALAGTALIAHFAHFKVPFWPAVLNSYSDFGWAPSRNQTSDALALTGIVAMALAYHDLREKRWIALIWIVGLAVIGTALVLAYSRAGIALFFFGSGFWALVGMRSSAARKYLAVLASGLVLLLAVFLIFGGETRDRLRATRLDPAQDFRLVLQREAVQLAAQTPWLGIGLGNFESVFRLTREPTFQQNRVVHPESDWAWLAVEMGFLAPLAMAGLVVWWGRGCYPFLGKSGPGVRFAAVIAGFAFLAHSFIDVSGHRLGTVVPALFLMGLGLHSQSRGVVRAWVAPVFRGVGLLLLSVGGCWILSARGYDLFPTSATLVRLRERASSAAEREDFAAVIGATTTAVGLAPLDWRFYAQRAVAELESNTTADAIRDFRIARFLQPHWTAACMFEADAWLAAGHPEYALEAWRDALDREPAGETKLFYQMLEATRSLPGLRGEVRSWARGRPSYEVCVLQSADAWEFKGEIDAVLFEDPDLQQFSENQRRDLFEIWAQRGNADELAELLRAHPSWQKYAWKFMASYAAARQDFRFAYEMVSRFSEPPKMPHVTSAGGAAASLERAFVIDPADLVTGLALYAAQVREGSSTGALRTLRTLRRNPASPRYLGVLEAQLYAAAQDWERAWTTWQEATR